MPISRSVAVVVGAGALVAALSAACVGRVAHFEWVVVGAQIAVLLPALLYGLKGGAGEQSSERLPIPNARMMSAAFLACAALGSFWLNQGTIIPDETSYWFEARVLASGRLMADAPPGATDDPRTTPRPLFYNHHVLTTRGWFSKYPLGWPAVLAVGERLRAPWLMNPLLALLLLMVTRAIARRLFDERTADVAAWMAALSPLFLANGIGLMSHATCGVLVVSACRFCFEGVRTLRTRPFVWMVLALAATFHVRPYSGFIAACVLGCGTLVALRRKRGVLLRFAGLSVLFAAAAAGSMLLYNHAMTGDYRLSPYALYRGLSVPVEVSGDWSTVLRNISRNMRFSAQSTAVYTFPFVFLLAAYGFWRARKSGPEVWILAALFPAFVVAHLVQPHGSGSFIGERYWFEAFFAVAILGARGAVLLMQVRMPDRRAAVAAVAVLTGLQIVLSVTAVRAMDERSRPYREVRAAAERYGETKCVVFLHRSEGLEPTHLNLNRPDWRAGAAFYLVDPGDDAQRADWARRMGRARWAVVSSNP